MNRLCGALLIFFSLLSGCLKYTPIQKENILSSPIKIEANLPNEATTMSKSEYLIKVFNNIDVFLLYDDLANKEATEMALQIYASEYLIQMDVNSLIHDAISRTMANPGLYIDHDHDFTQIIWTKPGINISLNDGKIGTGKINATTSSKWEAHNVNLGKRDNYSANAKIDMDLQYTLSADKIIYLTLNRVGYFIDCDYSFIWNDGIWGNSKCLDFFVSINDRKLENALRKISINIPQGVNYYEAALTIKKHLNSRYIKANKRIPEAEITYNVDFTTAKSRLQRALRYFEYDDKTSTFIFHRPVKISVLGANKEAAQYYRIALFPEKSGTAVAFSGNYDYFKDTFGGKDRVTDYDSMMDSYKIQVDKLLRK